MSECRIGSCPGPAVVCVQGLGFVGAAMAVAVASARDEHGEPRFSVVGLDVATPPGLQRIAAVSSGRFPFPTTDESLVEATWRAHVSGNLTATSDSACLAHADVVLVDVQLDVDTRDDVAWADLTPFREAVRVVGSHMKVGALVIVETTVPPGTCERVVRPELAAALRRRRMPADGFLLAHSYERVMPGDEYLSSITDFWRVYAGYTTQAADVCEAFLSQVINITDYPLTRLASTTASELAKVVENSYRASNIAFIEEWARFAEAAGVNLFDVIRAIRTRPTHSNIRQPGFGVGGYCLTKDPLFGGIAARQLLDRPDLTFPFSEMAVRTNRAMPLVSVDRLQSLLGGSLAAKRILLLGVAYRRGVSDTRFSPSQVFAKECRRRGADVVAHDPLVKECPELEGPVLSDLPPASTVDAVVLAVNHPDYHRLDFHGWLRGCRPVVLDANAVLSEAQRHAVVDAGCVFAAIGEG